MPATDARGPRGAPAPLLVVAAVVVAVSVGSAQGLWVSNLHNGLLALAFAGVGAYVLRQRPGHREGLLFLTTGAVEAVIYLGRQVGLAATAGEVSWWGWLGVWPVALALALVTLAVLCFPDGRLPFPRWRWVAVGVGVVAGTCATLSALWPVEYDAVGLRAEHPLAGATPPAVDLLWGALAHPAYVAFQVLWVVAVVSRWRVAGGHVRVQLAWLVAAAGMSAVALLVGLAVAGTPLPGVLAASLVPLAAGWAVVHGQHAAAHTALTWLSRSVPEDADLPDALAAALGEALSARLAVLWLGPADDLQPVGVWPRAADPAEGPGEGERHRRTVRVRGEVAGAVTVDRSRGEGLTIAEGRLMDDLAAQAALVLERQSLAAVIDREQRAGHLEGLSGREQEVLALLARGLSNAAIAAELHLSIKTVEPVVSAVFTKLGLHADLGTNRRVLAALAYLRA